MVKVDGLILKVGGTWRRLQRTIATRKSFDTRAPGLGRRVVRKDTRAWGIGMGYRNGYMEMASWNGSRISAMFLGFISLALIC